MRVSVYGSTGFIGSAIAGQFELLGGAEVSRFSRSGEGTNGYVVDLSNYEQTLETIKNSRPDVIVNAAGIIGGSEEELRGNVVFTENILKAVVQSGLQPQSILICGSAAEYGNVDPNELPVSEENPLRPTSPYAKSKAEETALALGYRERYNLSVVVARLFNPIGPGMKDRFLVPSLLRQVKEIKAGERTEIEVSRLDSKRDYLHITDLALAFCALAAQGQREAVYNVGSGVSTSNSKLIELLINSTGIGADAVIRETQSEPELQVASEADISRLRGIGWSPIYTIEDAIQEIVKYEF